MGYEVHVEEDDGDGGWTAICEKEFGESLVKAREYYESLVKRAQLPKNIIWLREWKAVVLTKYDENEDGDVIIEEWHKSKPEMQNPEPKEEVLT